MLSQLMRLRLRMMAGACAARFASTQPSTRTGASASASTSASTHEVTNQASMFDMNVYSSDPWIPRGAWDAEPGTVFGEDVFEGAGALYGSAEHFAVAEAANAHRPVLHSYDRVGVRVNAARFHPAWDEVMGVGARHGVGAGVWAAPQVAGRYTARGVMLYLHSQWEQGSTCPLVMTNAAGPVLAAAAADTAAGVGGQAYAQMWLDRLVSGGYDGADVPAGSKPGAIFGMSMTEKQGGSDVRSNTTRASKVDGARASQLGLTEMEAAARPYTLVGHKWFTSAPMSDAFITLAYSEEGMSAFLVPRWLEGGERNEGFQVMRLKNKLGDLSNASSEVEYRDAVGFLLGKPGRGIATILEMVHHTRLDCVTGSAASMRIALARAAHHASERSVFGATLSATPLAANVLADLALEAQASALMAFELMQAFEGAANGDRAAAATARVATALAKFYVCKRLPHFTAEAMEMFGGCGYVDDAENMMPRLFRQSPLNAIWEGSGSVQALDFLRVVAREPEALVGWLAALENDLAASPVARAMVTDSPLLADLRKGRVSPGHARALMITLAVAWQASLMIKHADPVAADVFISRIASSPLYGGLDAPAADLAAITDAIFVDNPLTTR